MHTRDKGIYVLVMELREAAMISAGKLLEARFRPGIYLYVGSARKGLRPRLHRHLTQKKKIHWHIDHLLQWAQVEQIWVKRNFFKECRTAEKINGFLDGDSCRISRFGSSDCRCKGHLFFSPHKKEELDALRAHLDFDRVEFHENHV